MKRFTILIFLFVLSLISFRQVWAVDYQKINAQGNDPNSQINSHDYEAYSLYGEIAEYDGFDPLEQIDDYDACCNAIDDYESITCSEISNKWARMVCLFSKNRAKESAKEDVLEYCGPNVFSNYSFVQISCSNNRRDEILQELISNIR